MLKKIILIICLSALLLAADSYWLNRNSQTGAEKAYNYYKTVYQQKKDYTSSWQFARAAQFYAEHFVQDNDLKKKIFTEGKDAAAQATQLDDTKPDGHYWLGANTGSWAEANGILESLNYADDIAEEMTKTVEIDPTYKNGSPYAIRAKVYYKAPGWPLSVGDPKKAEADFAEALKLAKGKNRKVYRFYAEYLLQKGDKQKAVEIIQQGLAIPYDKTDSVLEDSEINFLKALNNK